MQVAELGLGVDEGGKVRTRIIPFILVCIYTNPTCLSLRIQITDHEGDITRFNDDKADGIPSKQVMYSVSASISSKCPLPEVLPHFQPSWKRGSDT